MLRILLCPPVVDVQEKPKLFQMVFGVLVESGHEAGVLLRRMIDVNRNAGSLALQWKTSAVRWLPFGKAWSYVCEEKQMKRNASVTSTAHNCSGRSCTLYFTEMPGPRRYKVSRPIAESLWSRTVSIYWLTERYHDKLVDKWGSSS